MNSIRIQAGAVSSFFRAAPNVIWIGTVFVLLAAVASVPFFFLWKFVVGMPLDMMTERLTPNTAFMVTLGLSVFLYGGFIVWLASLMWVHVNQVFYRDKARQRFLGKGFELFSAYVHASMILAGVGAITWLASVAVISRLPGDSGVQTIVFAVLVAVVFSPLISRLWLLPVVSAIEPGGAWNKLQESTAGRGFTLIVSMPLQLILAGAAAAVFMRTVWFWVRPVVDTLLEGNYVSVKSMSLLISGSFGLETLLSVLCFAVIAGPLLSLLATLQVSVVRTYVASEEDSVSIEVKTKEPELTLDTDEKEEIIDLSELYGNVEADSAGDPLAGFEASEANEAAEADPLAGFNDLASRES